ncbi:VOC family protein [Sphaerimonospora thailandensis]|nr:VOC family protein [Sphaerimonospora thailandensis]
MALIHHVGITISDLERSHDFYVRLLGMSHLADAAQHFMRRSR